MTFSYQTYLACWARRLSWKETAEIFETSWDTVFRAVKTVVEYDLARRSLDGVTENVVWQYYSGQEYYTPKLPCDATQIGRFRTAIGKAGVEALLKATIDTAVQSKAVTPKEFERVIVDTTVQEKAIAHPVDSRLLEIARGKVAQTAKRVGITLKQTFAKEGKALRRKAGGYAHSRQFRRLRRAVKRQRTNSALCCVRSGAS